MRKFLFLLLFFGYLQAQIIDIKNINEIKKTKINKETLIVFDLDNTIMRPKQSLGSDQWFYNRLEAYQGKGFDYNEAKEKTLTDFYEIQAITKVQLVEEDVRKIIGNLQKDNYLVVGLTARDPDFSLAALKQLNSLDVDLSKTAPYKKRIFFENGSSFRKGILFAFGQDKGKILSSFFEKINFKPKSIIFIDDKLSHVKEMENFCKSSKIKFIGYRYGYLDDNVKEFNAEIANIQQKYLTTILSDEEALKMVVR